MRIYTKTGDAGETGLLGGGRVPKTCLRINALGDVDELNAVLGQVGSDEETVRLQRWLFDLGAELSAPPGSKFDVATIGDRQIAWLEQAIDRHMSALPALKAFILPGGSPSAAVLHQARAVCRRAERAILALHDEEPVRENVRVFVNRLSDYLFAAARTANAAAGVPDVEWRRQEEPC